MTPPSLNSSRIPFAGNEIVTIEVPDRGAKFKVRNGDPSGVVQSDRLEVEIPLSGPERAAVIQAQLKDPARGSLRLGVWLDETVHPTQIPLEINGNKLLLNP